MKDAQIVEQLIALLGGEGNIVSVTNCMTRLRVVVKEEAAVQDAQLQNVEKVLAVVHDRAASYEIVVGPGNSRKFADICHDKGLPAAAAPASDWKSNKQALAADRKDNPAKRALKLLGDIFVPLIPGIITAGLCAGFASLIAQLVPNYKDIAAWNLLWQLLSLINVSFMTYITAWTGYRAAERFGATPILGGMLGMITSLAGINEVAQILGLYNSATPLDSVLMAGKGGVLAVVVGVFIMSLVEKFIRKRMPANLDVIFTPLLTVIVCAIPYVLLIMPAFGYVSGGIAWLLGQACLSQNVIVRIVVGFVASAVFLPLVACGMHHGMIALYTVQLQQLGCVTLYPALAMAGAGQVGAAIALYIKAKRLGHQKLCSVIGGALPAGFLGVGEPLIYGVTLPMGRPFLTAGLGAGFGGAFVAACQVASTTWGPSGVLGLFVMTAGEGGAVNSIAMYAIGLLISYVMGFIITAIRIKDDVVAEALGGIESAESAAVPAIEPAAAAEPTLADPAAESAAAAIAAAPAAPANDPKHPSAPGPKLGRTVKHGEPIRVGSVCAAETSFRFVVNDAVGMHARPAAALAKLAAGFTADVVIRNGDHAASAKSILELMMLEATQGSTLEIRVKGDDANAVAAALKRFLEENL